MRCRRSTFSQRRFWLLASVAMSLSAVTNAALAGEIPLETVQIFIISRGLERLAITAVGGVAIVLGYKLFDRAISNESAVEARSPGGYKFRLTRIGPGVLFCLFGTILLGFSILRAPEYEKSISQNLTCPKGDATCSVSKEDVKGMSPVPASQKIDNEAYIKSITTIQDMCTPGRFPNLSPGDVASLGQARNGIGELKKSLVDSSKGTGSFVWWEEHAEIANGDPIKFSKLPAQEQQRYHDLNNLIQDPLGK